MEVDLLGVWETVIPNLQGQGHAYRLDSSICSVLLILALLLH